MLVYLVFSKTQGNVHIWAEWQRCHRKIKLDWNLDQVFVIATFLKDIRKTWWWSQNKGRWEEQN